jgi:hypothetical protein
MASGDGTSSSKRGRGVTSLPAASGQAGPAGAASPKAPPPETSDYRHFIRAAQWENLRRLGRDIPLGISLILNGDYRELMPEGKQPYDWFLDS